MTVEITNVRIDKEHMGYCLAWHADGFRWHVWLDDDLQITRSTSKRPPTLYKNSMAKHREPGYFEPRRMDATNAANKPMVDSALAYMREHDLVAKTEQAAQRKEDKRLAEAAAEARENRKHAAGPVLFDALSAIMPLIADWEHDPTKNWAHRQAADALDQATKE